jgi:hypothetical protein
MILLHWRGYFVYVEVILSEVSCNGDRRAFGYTAMYCLFCWIYILAHTRKDRRAVFVISDTMTAIHGGDSHVIYTYHTNKSLTSAELQSNVWQIHRESDCLKLSGKYRNWSNRSGTPIAR